MKVKTLNFPENFRTLESFEKIILVKKISTHTQFFSFLEKIKVDFRDIHFVGKS